MVKIQASQVEKGVNGMLLWEVTVPWSAGVTITRWGMSLSEAMQRVASAVQKAEQAERVLGVAEATVGGERAIIYGTRTRSFQAGVKALAKREGV